MSTDDRRFMQEAIRLARLGVGVASPNPPVGCVIVRRGAIVGRGTHVYRRRDHAEVAALNEAGGRARGATAYVTLEPCCHHGRTPPCAPALVSAGVRRVVVAVEDPNPEVNGRGIAALKAAGVRVDTGMLREQAQRLIEVFACHVTTGSPFVVAKAGMTLDGRIGIPGRGRLQITSGQSSEVNERLRHRLDAVLVGVGTVLEDDPRLTYRGKAEKGRALVRVVLDSRLRTPPSAHLFDAASSPVILYCSASAPAGRRKALEKRGAEIVRVPRLRGGLSLQHVLRDLGRREILGILVEGGSTVHWSFLSQGMVDKFYFIVAPLLLGGRTALPAVAGAGFAGLESAARLKITSARLAGGDLVVEAYPRNSRSLISPWLRPEAPPCARRSGRRS